MNAIDLIRIPVIVIIALCFAFALLWTAVMLVKSAWKHITEEPGYPTNQITHDIEQQKINEGKRGEARKALKKIKQEQERIRGIGYGK